MKIIDMMAFNLWISDEITDDVDLDDDIFKSLNTESLENINNYWIRWKKYYIPSLKEEHCGDCTKIPMTCIRCLTEDYYEKAKKILIMLI